MFLLLRTVPKWLLFAVLFPTAVIHNEHRMRCLLRQMNFILPISIHRAKTKTKKNFFCICFPSLTTNCAKFNFMSESFWEKLLPFIKKKKIIISVSFQQKDNLIWNAYQCLFKFNKAFFFGNFCRSQTQAINYRYTQDNKTKLKVFISANL